ncbi:ricin-type beta-trefoil lectin domain protein [Photobacterium damselae]|uniref:ricin-type beta-trefoil lectin domain protein n=1 Tax=Photobacterium damselae TaxID=38293 RepID=UPI000D056FE4|nr:ricin-type beta-trefoil lectin domain protein [Photobacterium damselae]PSB78531.1 hypothetical protein C5F62_17730 [Photobacterium damselae subsp. damselae]
MIKNIILVSCVMMSANAMAGLSEYASNLDKTTFKLKVGKENKPGKFNCVTIAGGSELGNPYFNGQDVVAHKCSEEVKDTQFYSYINGEIKAVINTFPSTYVSHDYCIDVDNGIDVPGNKVQLFECNGSKAQKFTPYTTNKDQVVFKTNAKNCLSISENGAEVRACDLEDNTQLFDAVNPKKMIRVDFYDGAGFNMLGRVEDKGLRTFYSPKKMMLGQERTVYMPGTSKTIKISGTGLYAGASTYSKWVDTKPGEHFRLQSWGTLFNPQYEVSKIL